MDGRELPAYTILLPVFREKPETLRTLFRALSELDYPKHKLNGLLLVEDDDLQTQEAVQALDTEHRLRPAWLKTLLIPPGGPRTKPKAMIYGLLYSTGELLTIFDAEDRPDPDQLKKAAAPSRARRTTSPASRPSLNYYNSRQNLLTRWFTIEYVDVVRPVAAGPARHARADPAGRHLEPLPPDLLRELRGWDPFNVTEDADLGLRLHARGYRSGDAGLDDLRGGERRYRNWLRQRSRWIKGYMQTFLVHTRDPVLLYRELGAVNVCILLRLVGGLVYTVLISPIFWLLLVLWLLFTPGWIPALFPGPSTTWRWPA